MPAIKYRPSFTFEQMQCLSGLLQSNAASQNATPEQKKLANYLQLYMIKVGLGMNSGSYVIANIPTIASNPMDSLGFSTSSVPSNGNLVELWEANHKLDFTVAQLAQIHQERYVGNKMCAEEEAAYTDALMNGIPHVFKDEYK